MKDDGFSIWPPYKAFYEQSLLSRTTAALESVEIANQIIQNLQIKDSLPDDWRRILLDQMQNIVIQSGAISKFFWPPRDGENKLHRNRGEYLQKIFKIHPESALKSRVLRDHIEHFDEKLDRYLQNPIAGHIFPEFVADEIEKYEVPQHIFRGYYLKSGVFQILNEKIEINKIVEEIVRLHDYLTTEPESLQE